MNTQELIEKYLKKEVVIKNVAAYVVYYQISLGQNVLESVQDINLATKKLIELNLTLDPNDVVLKVFLIIIDNIKDKNLWNNLDNIISKNAFLQSLEDFVKKDNELLNKERYLHVKKEQIENNSYLTTNLKMKYMREFPIFYKDYAKYITDDYIKKIVGILDKNFINQKIL